MKKNAFELLKQQRFLPLFITQMLTAFNDNAFKNALVIFITYRLTATNLQEELLVTLAAGLFILPFFLFSATAGQLADKYNKAKVIRVIKGFEILLMLCGTLGFFTGNILLLFSTLFFIGVHSSFFGPIKYSILPDELKNNELMTGNAFIEASTFLAILLGTFTGSLFITTSYGPWVIGSLITSIALLGFLSSLSIPNTKPANPTLTINPNFFEESWRLINKTKENQTLYLCILGISWFWLVGAIFLTEFPSFTKEVLHGQPGIVSLFLMLFSIGIATGSLLCNRLQKGDINAKYVPLGVFGMSLFILDLSFTAGRFIKGEGHQLIGTMIFLSSLTGWHILADILFLAICAGVYVVPLYTLVQHLSDPRYRSRTIACNNIVNSFFIVVAVGVTLSLLALGLTLPSLFMLLGFLNIFVALITCLLLPEALIKSFIQRILRFFYDVELEGIAHYHQAGEKIMLIANHTSLLDIILLSAFLPDKLTIAINTAVKKKWWVKPFIALVDTYSVDPRKPMATKSLIKLINEGKKCLIFPEGRLTTMGSLMKMYEGPGMIADKTNATIVPIRIDGAQYTPFTKVQHKARVKWFPKIKLTILPPVRFTLPKQASSRANRRTIADHLYRLMSEMLFESSHYHQTLFQALLDASAIHASHFEVVEDIERKPLTYRQFLMRCFILGKMIEKNSAEKEAIGILLPTSITALVTFFGMHAYNRTPALLNFSSGLTHILSACHTAAIKTIYTSSRFVNTAKLEDLIEQLKKAGFTVIFLEDLRKKISPATKIYGFLGSFFPRLFHAHYAKKITPSDTAVILFTSGSEGVPKGVLLSHENLLANCYQMHARVDFTSQDIMFNTLPVFHCFGLTVGAILPLVSGIRVFFYPSPLHYRIIPELIYDTNTTIFFGTDTFLTGYARYAHPYDFYSVRYIFAGAEKLKPETAKLYAEKYGVRVFEGYGATETAPVISTNTPILSKNDSVGVINPGMDYRLEKVEGISQGGRLLVKGPNVMKGYIRENKPGLIESPQDGWYDTGDIVTCDEKGFITIIGRAKRFAKIAGEMVSLTAVELTVNQLWPNHLHAAVSIPDPKKGEQIILLTDYTEAKRDELITYAKNHGFTELSLPKKILIHKDVPILASGKIDYPNVQKFITEEMQAESI